MFQKKFLAILVGGLLCGGGVYAKVFRATEVNSTLLSEFSKGTLTDTVIQFRQGDLLPLSFAAEGDLFEATPSPISSIVIKKDFWLFIDKNRFEISFDGVTYKSFNEVINGSFEAGATNSSGIANAITLALKLYLK